MNSGENMNSRAETDIKNDKISDLVNGVQGVERDGWGTGDLELDSRGDCRADDRRISERNQIVGKIEHMILSLGGG